jgi:hypothetical protein
MIHVHGENPNYDYMINFKKAIEENIERFIICYNYNDDMMMYDTVKKEFILSVKGGGFPKDCHVDFEILPQTIQELKKVAEKQDLNAFTVHVLKEYKTGEPCPIAIFEKDLEKY